MFSAPFLVTVLDRVKAILRRVARPAAEPGPSKPVEPAVPESVSPAVRGLVQNWITTKLRALSALMRRIDAGETSAWPAGEARKATREAKAPVNPVAASPKERLPRGFGWMCAFGPNVRRDGQALTAWLNTPAMRATILAAPGRMALLIGPLLNATGGQRPDWFPVVPTAACDARSGFPSAGDENLACRAYASEPLEVSTPEPRSCVAVPPPPTRGGRIDTRPQRRPMPPPSRPLTALRVGAGAVPGRGSLSARSETANSCRRKIKTELRSRGTRVHFVAIP
jgi:hypothetical protein